MGKKLTYKIIFILALIGLFVYYSFPLKKRINLGLDLQGGMHLLLKVDTSKLSEKAK
ncbi:MAG: protein translocase subunit SecD, partial [Candidatus Omnitrophica bacterium]|nr:protein translocase subunit SecD [Candidatus Omnitrophota bacterium]